MNTALSRIWTQEVVSISRDDNHFNKRALSLFELIHPTPLLSAERDTGVIFSGGVLLVRELEEIGSCLFQEYRAK